MAQLKRGVESGRGLWRLGGGYIALNDPGKQSEAPRKHIYFQLSLETREVFRVCSSKLGQVVSYDTFLLGGKSQYFEGCFNFPSNGLGKHQQL